MLFSRQIRLMIVSVWIPFPGGPGAVKLFLFLSSHRRAQYSHPGWNIDSTKGGWVARWRTLSDAQWCRR